MMNPVPNTPSIAGTSMFDRDGHLKEIPVFQPDCLAATVPPGPLPKNELGVRPDIFGWSFDRHPAFPETPPPPVASDPQSEAVCPFCAEQVGRRFMQGQDILCRTLDTIPFKHNGHIYEASFFYRYHAGCYNLEMDGMIKDTVSQLQHAIPNEWKTEGDTGNGGQELAGV